MLILYATSVSTAAEQRPAKEQTLEVELCAILRKRRMIIIWPIEQLLSAPK
jgi:hypothetical protein